MIANCRFKAVEFQYFNWLYNIAPCFPINATKINVITDPSKYYETLCNRFKNAKNRISMASLYVGTGPLEEKLLEITRENLLENRTLKLKVLLDYQRGTRGAINSENILDRYLNDIPNKCKLSLYQTPKLLNSWSKWLPSRYNELVGLQHMKLYIADNCVVISGANCSNDYFQQRQDRYIEIEDADLANFYCELIDEVCQFSKTALGDNYDQNILSKDTVVDGMSKNICTLIETWKNKQMEKLETNKNLSSDTLIFPLIQMGEFNIIQDEIVTRGILMSAPKDSEIKLATGYFNLTSMYAKTLLDQCKSNTSFLMAHPNANGFQGAAGLAGGIPYAYSLIAKEFLQRIELHKVQKKMTMYEYERPGWTFHAKGLWYYPPGSHLPWATVVGSANLGARSVQRDLEAQAAIFTTSPDLQQRLHEECSSLHQYADECSRALLERKGPLWVHAFVTFFRSFF